MKRLLFLIALYAGISHLVVAQMTYSKAKIYVDEDGVQNLSHLGIDVTEGIVKKGVFFISDFSSAELAKIAGAGYSYDILIPDVSEFYLKRNLNASMNKADYKSPLDEEWPVPDGFTFGSMGGFLTFDEVVEKLDDMAANYPNLITPKVSIGQSIEGREQWMVRISDNPGVDEGEPQVLYTALHHAREPESMMQMIFFMYYLLENYDTDPEVQNIVNNTDMYFIPVVNPDGYEYNRTTNPNGGGMWRKNRRNNGGGSYGVDPNRNYGYKWGWDNNGSSPDPGDETYRGTAAFSEPEIANMRDFVNAHNFLLAFNYHTFSNLLLYPWGWTEELCPDNDAFATMSFMMTAENGYIWGPSSTTIYPTNGDANDWMYGEQTMKNKIFSSTTEVGGYDDGFWPPQSRIIPLAQENMLANFLLAYFAGNYATVKDVSPDYVSQLTGYFSFDLTRLGLQEGGVYTVSIEPVSGNISSVGAPKTFSGLAYQETVHDSIDFHLSATMVSPEIKFKVVLDNGDYTIEDTITKYYGQQVVIFEDDASGMSNWTGQWAITAEDFHSAPSSITDSPNSNYGNNSTKIITMNDFVDLPIEAVSASMSFWAKWDIEAGWDYVEVEISTNGTTWTPLSGNYTKTGNDYQDPGQPIYDGTQNEWVKEEIPLMDYLGEQVKFRFKLVSDDYETRDGYYFDDFQISWVDNLVGVNEDTKYAMNIKVFPNPVSDMLSFKLPEENLNVRIYNVLGAEVERFDSQNRPVYRKNIQDWKPGVYFYEVKKRDKVLKRGRFIKE